MEDIVEELKDRIEDLEAEVEDYKRELESLKHFDYTARLDLEDEVEDLQREIKELEGELSEAESTVKHLKNRYEDMSILWEPVYTFLQENRDRLDPVKIEELLKTSV